MTLTQTVSANCAAVLSALNYTCCRGELSGQATQALLALFTLSLLVTFILCLNVLHFNYFKGIFHTFICVFMNLLAAVWFEAEECCPLLCKLKTPQLADHG